MSKKVIFIGCGKVATGAAFLLHEQGIEVQGVRRSPHSLPSYMQGLPADVCDPASLKFLKNSTADTVVYSVTASGFTEADYTAAYVDGLKNTINACNADTVKRLLFVSSTSVYHQNDDSWVNENSATKPTRFNGQIMLEAERLATSSGNATSVRFSGIYGPGRNRMIDRVRQGKCTPEDAAGYTNRIHSDDCSAVIAHLVTRNDLPSVILASDSKPVSTIDVETFIAKKLGIEKRYAESTANTKRIAGSKQCCNRLLMDSGFEFTYPDYQAGYSSLIESL